MSDGPANGKLEVGDIITEAEGTKVSSINEINNIKNNYEIGDNFNLKVYRNNDYITVTIKLSEQPESFEETTVQNNYYYSPFNY